MVESGVTGGAWTIGRLLQWTTEYLRERGSESPRLDAEVLLAHCRGSRRIDLYTSFDEQPREEVLGRFRSLVKRRAAHEPVAYLVGMKEFFSLQFRVTGDVLIPRPETELLVLTLLDLVKKAPLPCPTIADIGTGSGVIAITGAKHLPNGRFVAVDVSEPALVVARENAAIHGVSDRVRFVLGDLFSTLSATERFDIVASNPPYVSQEELGGLAPDVREHEPTAALLAGPRGTEVIERLVPGAATFLNAGGWLLLEVSPSVASAAEEIVRRQGGFTDIQVKKDLAGHPRLVVSRRA